MSLKITLDITSINPMIKAIIIEAIATTAAFACNSFKVGHVTFVGKLI